MSKSPLIMSEPLPTPEGFSEANDRRRAALQELVQARAAYDRQERAKHQSYSQMLEFLNDNKQDLPPFVQQYLTAWEREHKDLLVVHTSAENAVMAAQNALVLAENDAREALERFNAVVRAERFAMDSKDSLAYENSKLRTLMSELHKFSKRKDARNRND